MTMSANRQRDRQSLQDLAKMASGLTPPPSAASVSSVSRPIEAKKDDSGIVDLAAAVTADPHAAARAQHTPLASQGLFDEEPHSQRAPMSAQHLPQQPAPSVPPPSSIPPSSVRYAHTPSAPPVAPYAAQRMGNVHPLAQKKSGGAAVALVIGGLVTLAAAAAGGVFVMKSRATRTPEPVAMATPQATTTPTTAAAPVAPTPVAPGEPSIDPNSLPAASTAKTAAKSRPAGAKPSLAPNAAEPLAPPTPEPPKLSEKDLVGPSTPSTGGTGDLGTAMKKEVGDEKEKVPAAQVSGTSAGNVPQKPSQGAVTGALGAVMPSARACLGPDDAISRASVIFSSDGVVQSVSVSGGAAGKPAEACIKAALTKAKLTPFAEPSYTANITIRHN